MQVKVRDSLSTGVSMQIIHPSKQKKYIIPFNLSNIKKKKRKERITISIKI